MRISGHGDGFFDPGVGRVNLLGCSPSPGPWAQDLGRADFCAGRSEGVAEYIQPPSEFRKHLIM